MVSRHNRWNFGLKLRREVVARDSLTMASRHAHWKFCGERVMREVLNEYGMGSDMSMSGDVYCFGILLIKIFVSRRPTNNILISDGQTLPELVKLTLLHLEVGAGINNVENSSRQDNLNGAQILGRIIRVDLVTKYKKKEEGDEETEQRKREERGVCRDFQRVECTRGAGCKFSHDEQFEGNKEGFRRGNKDSSFRPTGNGKALETHPKQSDMREEKSSRMHDNVENSREDNNKREEKRSRRQDTDEFEHGSIEDHDRREEKRLRRHTDGEFELRSGGDQHWREENRSRRHGDEGEFERRPKEDHDRREEKRSTRHNDREFELR
ncbi:hypothetical protein LWI28_021991 [Acer negundo]|uniref:C3H1-type domain-containing protein n=1 Tax=Acer negundo TaxID=4023 RepID=A0AAD5JQ64_ACENE|nr:hypothetical protein LWI28_021991 [Acer negundo]